MQSALRSKKYRVIGSKKNVADYNTIECVVDITKERKAKSTATVDLFGSIKNDKLQVNEGTAIGVELGVMVNCSVTDAFTEELVYEGSGQATTFISDKSNVYAYFSRAMKSAVKQAIGRMGKANSKKNKNFIYAEAIGYDDGVRSTTAKDLQEAISTAKVLVVEKAGTRVRTEAGYRSTFTSNGNTDRITEVDIDNKKSVSDANIVHFDVVEDFGYVNGRYKVKIGARLVLN